ncbi:hypothetical protein [Caenispirillum salinarum]|uniref:hypothetical protein n=1 Tax=Caenispirillum salinarum TaxID=859058 RepID=UPI00384E35CE
MIVCGGLYVPWHLGLVAAPSALGAQGWLVHEIQFGAVPLLVALSTGGIRLRSALAIVAAWLPGRLVATFMAEPSVLVAAGAAAALPVLVAVLAAKTARPLPARLALAALAASAMLLHWEVWRYGTADSAWFATAAGAAALFATAKRPVPSGMLVFLVVGLSLAAAGAAAGSLALQRAALAALTLGVAAQAMPAGPFGIARGLSAAGATLIVAGLALPGAITALVGGCGLWLASGVVTASVSGARGGASAGRPAG